MTPKPRASGGARGRWRLRLSLLAGSGAALSVAAFGFFAGESRGPAADASHETKAAAPQASPTKEKLPGDFMRGVNFAHIHRRGHGYGSEPAGETLDRLKKLGVNWIILTPFGYQPRIDSTEIVGYPANPGDAGFFQGTDPSMTEADLARAIDHAHERGMRVMLKPHIWCDAFWNGPDWHGTIDQKTAAGHRKWWQSYQSFIRYYAKIATRHEVEAFCLGTELVAMTERSPQRWRALAEKIDRTYPGKLTYAAHFDSEMQRIPFWEALDFIGVCAYFPLEAERDASVTALTEAWQPHRRTLSRMHQRTDQPIVFLEAGFRSVPASFQEPWAHGEADEASERAQVRAYAAMFEALHDQRWWRGVFPWKVFTDPTLARRRHAGKGFTFIDKPAESIIDRWY